jgi:hypothetical protein
MGKTSVLPSADMLFGVPKPRPMPPPAVLPVVAPPSAAGAEPKKPEEAKPAFQVVPLTQAPLPVVRTETESREKFTFRFDSATLQELDEVWMELRRRTGKKIRKSWIVEAAVRHIMHDRVKALEILKEEMEQARDE